MTTSGSTSTSSRPPAVPSAAPSRTATSTLSLIPWLGSQIFGLETPGAKLNYGVNKVRFPNPVKVGKRIRLHVVMGEVTEIPAGRQITLRHTIEIEGEQKPGCVAETVVLLLS